MAEEMQEAEHALCAPPRISHAAATRRWALAAAMAVPSPNLKPGKPHFVAKAHRAASGGTEGQVSLPWMLLPGRIKVELICLPHTLSGYQLVSDKA